MQISIPAKIGPWPFAEQVQNIGYKIFRIEHDFFSSFEDGRTQREAECGLHRLAECKQHYEDETELTFAQTLIKELAKYKWQLEK